jgi:hypothetical protein
MTPVDPLFYALLAALALVFGYAARRAMRREPKRPVQEQAAEDLQEAVQAREAQPHAGASGHEAWGRGIERGLVAQGPGAREAARARPPAFAPADSPRRTRAQAMLGSRQGLREAVVAMTVLGPCRALQPHSTHGAEAADPEPRPRRRVSA